MDLGLRGRKALVTGASKGIGRACAEILAEEGCDVALVSRTAADLDAVRAKITGQHNVAVRVFPRGRKAPRRARPMPHRPGIARISASKRRVVDPAALPAALERALHAVRIDKRQALLNLICRGP